MQQNIINTTALQPGSQTEVISAIRKASAQSGVDFAFLLQEAKSESRLNPQAQAATSSARGLFQFIESTWLETMDKHGAKYGLEQQAAAITRDADGNLQVKDPQQREAILKLRENPHVSALMAAELTKDNEVMLEQKLGREVSHGELYMAHFLGAGGAAKFLDSLDNNPDIEAEYIVPTAARNNQAVFYKGGKALTLDQVYARFESKFAPPDYAQPDSGLTATNMLTAAASSAPVRQTLAADFSAAVAAMAQSTAMQRPVSVATHTPQHRIDSLHAQALSMMALSTLQALGTSTEKTTRQWVV